MAVPKKPATPSIPNAPGRPTTTGTDRLRRILSMKGDTAEAAGRVVDVLSPEVARSLATGSDGSRATLAAIWKEMTPEQKKVLVEKIATEFPNPRSPIGLSRDADLILRVASGKGISPEEAAAFKGAEGPSRDDVFSEVSPGDPTQPPNLSRLPVPEGFDPATARVKDPSEGTSKIESRPRLREPNKKAEMLELPDGRRRVVMQSEEGTGSVGPQDFPSFRLGGLYEAQLQANIEMQRNALLGIFGDQEGINAAIKQVEEGNQEIAAQFQAVRDAANKAHPIPDKPYPVGASRKDGMYDPKLEGPVRASTRNAQADFNDDVRGIVEGRPNSPVHQLKAGSRDVLSKVLEEISMDFPEGQGMPIQARFPSAEAAARMVLRNADPGMFDVTPLTPTQAGNAKGLLKDFGVKSQSSAGQLLGVFEPDLPYGQQPRQAKLQQAEEALARQLRERFGDNWGADYKPAPASDLSPAPESRIPEPGPGTSQDLADIPEEMGRPNTRGEPSLARSDADYERAMEEYRQYLKKPIVKGKTEILVDRNGSPLDTDESGVPYQPMPVGREGSTTNWLDPSENPIVGSRYKQDLEALDQPITGEPPKKTGRMWSELSPQEQHAAQYGGKPSQRAWEDNFSEYNNLQRKISEPLQAQRVAKAEELAGTIDNIDTTPAAEIRREIKKIEDFMYSPSRPLTTQEIARGEAKVAELKAKLQRSVNLDQLSGVVSDRKAGPLSKRVNQVQGKNPDVDAANRALDEAADPDAPAIRQKPARPNAINTPEAFKAKVDKFMEKSAGRSRGSKKFLAEGEALLKEAATLNDESSKALADAVRGAMAGKLKGGAAPKGGTAPKAEAAPKGDLDNTGSTADQIDSLESASTEIEENPSKVNPDNRKPQEPPKEIEQTAKDNVDVQKTADDAASKKPKQESDTIPPGTGSDKTPNDKPARTWGQFAGRATRAMGVPAALGLGGYALYHMMGGLREQVDQPWGTPPEGADQPPPAGQAAAGSAGILASGDEAAARTLTPEDRIRAVQARMKPIEINLNTQIPGSWNY